MERGFSHARVKKASPPRGHCRWARGAQGRRRAERSCGAFTLVPRGSRGNSCGHTSVQSFSPSQETVPSPVSGEGGVCAPLGGRGSSGAGVSLRSAAQHHRAPRGCAGSDAPSPSSGPRRCGISGQAGGGSTPASDRQTAVKEDSF